MSKKFKESRDYNVAEEIVVVILTRMKEEKEISGFLRSRHSDHWDAEGLDFLIFLESGLAIPLQVKTENLRHPYEKQYDEHIKKHPLVKFLVSIPVHFHSREPERVYSKAQSLLKEIISKAKPA